MPDINIRSVNLGHVQRGGNATLQDRLLGTRMATHAIDCILAGKTNRVIGIRANEIIDEDIVEALAKTKKINMSVVELANTLSK